MSKLPDRIAIDGDGFVWRVYPTHWSMPPTNDDNTEPPEPVTYYVRLDGVDVEALEKACAERINHYLPEVEASVGHLNCRSCVR